MSDDPTSPHGRNVALLIDADNASPDSLDPVLTILAELGTVNIRRAYGNWQKPALNVTELAFCIDSRSFVAPSQRICVRPNAGRVPRYSL